jgi:uncharacterized iron-regulated membrane protein
VVGAFSYFGIQYVVTVLHFSVGIAGLAFGLMTLCTGLLGIWFGGWWLDRLRADCLHDDMKSTERSVKSLLIMTVLAIPFAGASFIVGYLISSPLTRQSHSSFPFQSHLISSCACPTCGLRLLPLHSVPSTRWCSSC